MDKKFLYESEEEFQIIDSQCEVCINYNSGDFSEVCPKEKLDKIKNNLLSCEKKEIASVLDL